MNTRTWNLKLLATDEHPETTIEGVPHEAATNIVRGLMYGSLDRTNLHEVVAAARADRHEGPLAA